MAASATAPQYWRIGWGGSLGNWLIGSLRCGPGEGAGSAFGKGAWARVAYMGAGGGEWLGSDIWADAWRLDGRRCRDAARGGRVLWLNCPSCRGEAARTEVPRAHRGRSAPPYGIFGWPLTLAAWQFPPWAVPGLRRPGGAQPSRPSSRPGSHRPSGRRPSRSRGVLICPSRARPGRDSLDSARSRRLGRLPSRRPTRRVAAARRRTVVGDARQRLGTTRLAAATVTSTSRTGAAGGRAFAGASAYCWHQPGGGGPLTSPRLAPAEAADGAPGAGPSAEPAGRSGRGGLPGCRAPRPRPGLADRARLRRRQSHAGARRRPGGSARGILDMPGDWLRRFGSHYEWRELSRLRPGSRRGAAGAGGHGLR